MTKATEKQLRMFAKEEAKTAKLYRKLGFPTLAEDEAKHAKFFRNIMKK